MTYFSFITQIAISSNFRKVDIVNLDRIRKYNAVNLKNGYSILEIRTPRGIAP
jgi:hypothetical protein